MSFLCAASFFAHSERMKTSENQSQKNMLIKDQLGTHVLLQKRTNRAEGKGCL